MKKVTILCALFLISTSVFAQVGIGTVAPHDSSVLELNSTNKGFLMPRMTTTERDAINGGKPTKGLMIYNNDDNCIQSFNGIFWHDHCTNTLSGTANSSLVVSNPTYNGGSVIDSQGIAYNGDNVPSSATITVDLANTAPTDQIYGLIATDPNTGLQYKATGTIPASTSNHVVTLANNEVAILNTFYGTIPLTLTGASNPYPLSPRIDVKSIPGSATIFNEITIGSGTTEQTWMDRNVGALRVAETAHDLLSFGNHYQWGRPGDGHEISVYKGDEIDSGKAFKISTGGTVNTDEPGDVGFITTGGADWRTGANQNRWDPNGSGTPAELQGPCPTGYSIPTLAQLQTAFTTLGIPVNTVSTAAFDSALKIPISLFVNKTNGVISGPSGYLWSNGSETSGRAYYMRSVNGRTLLTNRADGFSMRCIKD